jgi:alanine racemase
VTHSDFDSGTPARAWVDVDLGALVDNARRVVQVSGSRLLPMVKANGYGLGAVRVARALEALDPWGFGVATIEEGAELRAAGIDRPVVVFSPLLPAGLQSAAGIGLRPVLCSVAELDVWLSVAPGRPFHVGVDTGMARAGVPWDDTVMLGAVRDRLKGLTAYEGVCTHFHSADSDGSSMEVQQGRFDAAVAALGPRPSLVHAANSAAALRGRRYAADLVRPGIYLYGGRAGDAVPCAVAALRARVIAVRRVATGDSVSYGATWRATKTTRVATLSIGYADGLLRSLGNVGSAELAGRPAQIRGRVTMDMTTVESPDAEVGDIATLFGGMITLDEQASAAGTISYELLTALSPRVLRRYGEAS